MIVYTQQSFCQQKCNLKIFYFRFIIAGGGAPEVELSLQLMEYANTLKGTEQYCFRAFAEALEIIPFTLAENAGLNPIATVTELRNRHAQGEITAGINVRKVGYF
jgi:T-complex protein 1 subunit delta